MPIETQIQQHIKNNFYQYTDKLCEYLSIMLNVNMEKTQMLGREFFQQHFPSSKRRNVSGYNVFIQENFNIFDKDMPLKHKIKILSNQWNDLSNEEKEKYAGLAQEKNKLKMEYVKPSNGYFMKRNDKKYRFYNRYDTLSYLKIFCRKKDILSFCMYNHISLSLEYEKGSRQRLLKYICQVLDYSYDAIPDKNTYATNKEIKKYIQEKLVNQWLVKNKKEDEYIQLLHQPRTQQEINMIENEKHIRQLRRKKQVEKMKQEQEKYKKNNLQKINKKKKTLKTIEKPVMRELSDEKPFELINTQVDRRFIDNMNGVNTLEDEEYEKLFSQNGLEKRSPTHLLPNMEINNTIEDENNTNNDEVLPNMEINDTNEDEILPNKELNNNKNDVNKDKENNSINKDAMNNETSMKKETTMNEEQKNKNNQDEKYDVDSFERTSMPSKKKLMKEKQKARNFLKQCEERCDQTDGVHSSSHSSLKNWEWKYTLTSSQKQDLERNKTRDLEDIMEEINDKYPNFDAEFSDYWKDDEFRDFYLRRVEYPNSYNPIVKYPDYEVMSDDDYDMDDDFSKNKYIPWLNKHVSSFIRQEQFFVKDKRNGNEVYIQLPFEREALEKKVSHTHISFLASFIKKFLFASRNNYEGYKNKQRRKALKYHVQNILQGYSKYKLNISQFFELLVFLFPNTMPYENIGQKLCSIKDFAKEEEDQDEETNSSSNKSDTIQE